MAKYELVMPKMGESIIEATVLKWLKQVGEEIEQEESILEIATDKVDSEVPSPVDGKLLEMRFQEGDVVPVGEVIAIIETEMEEVDGANSENGSVEEGGEEEIAGQIPFVPSSVPVLETVAVGTASTRFYSPLVLNIARKENIDMQELEKLPGSGRGGRVTKKDILAFVESRNQSLKTTVVSEPLEEVTERKPANVAPSPVASKPETPSLHITPKTFKHSGNYEIVEMDRMRKMIAENMIYSAHISAHVTSFVEADVTTLAKWRGRNKDAFMQQYGEKLTFTPLFIQAVVKALREHPRLNSSIEGNNILLKKDINIGIAVALPTDNLIVPVIKHADRMNLTGLAAAVNDLSKRARENKLKPDELEGGTYTVSNVGTFGNVMGTPIIVQPQLGILALGAIRKMPAVLETPEGDVIAIRHKMFLSHSYDHRVIDGALGGRFVRRVADLLESWDTNMEI